MTNIENGAADPASDARLTLLDDGLHHVVVWKRANMVVVAGRGAPRPTLLDLVVRDFAAGARPVHRLDRGTTGATIVAKSAFGQTALSDAFRRHLVDKRYLAIVEGTPARTKLTIDARLLRVDNPEARRGPMAWQTVDENGKRALTRVTVLGSGGGVSLVEARPETGRMHQIRAHLAHIGHPVVGDAQYGSTHALAPNTTFLHAWMVSFPVPGGDRAFIAASLPDNMRAFLKLHEIVDESDLVRREREFVSQQKVPTASAHGAERIQESKTMTTTKSKVIKANADANARTPRTTEPSRQQSAKSAARKRALDKNARPMATKKHDGKTVVLTKKKRTPVSGSTRSSSTTTSSTGAESKGAKSNTAKSKAVTSNAAKSKGAKSNGAKSNAAKSNAAKSNAAKSNAAKPNGAKSNGANAAKKPGKPSRPKSKPSTTKPPPSKRSNSKRR